MDIENQKIIQYYRDKLQSNSASGNLSMSSNIVSPVIDAGLEPNYVVRRNDTTSGTNTVVTFLASARKEYYLWGIHLSIIKDAACDMASGSVVVNVVPYESNVATAFVGISVLVSTAQSENVIIMLPKPIRLANASAITVTGSFTAGNCIRTETCYLTELEQRA